MNRLVRRWLRWRPSPQQRERERVWMGAVALLCAVAFVILAALYVGYATCCG